MSDTTTGDQIPATQATQATQAEQTGEGAGGLDTMYNAGESPIDVSESEIETAREIAAQHFSRLLYAPTNAWSRYVFHENDPHPFGAQGQRRNRE
ncbi:MAG: hypothetical protein ACM3N4_00155 [Nitrososphaerota archaeon]